MHPRGGASLIFVNPLAPCRSNFCLLYVFLLPGFCHTSRPTVLFAKKLHAGVVWCLHQRNSRNLFRNESRVTEPDFGCPILLDPAFHGKTGRPSEPLAGFGPFKSNLWQTEHNMAALWRLLRLIGLGRSVTGALINRLNAKEPVKFKAAPVSWVSVNPNLAALHNPYSCHYQALKPSIIPRHVSNAARDACNCPAHAVQRGKDRQIHLDGSLRRSMCE